MFNGRINGLVFSFCFKIMCYPNNSTFYKILRNHSVPQVDEPSAWDPLPSLHSARSNQQDLVVLGIQGPLYHPADTHIHTHTHHIKTLDLLWKTDQVFRRVHNKSCEVEKKVCGGGGDYWGVSEVQDGVQALPGNRGVLQKLLSVVSCPPPPESPWIAAATAHHVYSQGPQAQGSYHVYRRHLTPNLAVSNHWLHLGAADVRGEKALPAGSSWCWLMHTGSWTVVWCVQEAGQ